MKSIPLFFLILFGLSSCAAQMESTKAEDSSPQSVTLQIMDKTIWTLTVTPDGLKGNGINLQNQDGVIFGYIREKQVRYRLTKEGDEEKLDEGQSKLQMTRKENGIQLEGTSAGQRLQAHWGDAGLVLANPRISLTFKQAKSSVAQTILIDTKGQVKLVFANCDPSLLKKRPELLLLLAKLVLPEAYESLVAMN